MTFPLFASRPRRVTLRHSLLWRIVIFSLDVAHDYAQALIWYRKSAGQSFAPAQN
jgi:hypothetical protein